MAYQKQEGQGALFKNEDRKTDKHPQYKGDILIDGKEYWLAGWVKEGKNGKFFSLKASPKQENGRHKPGPDKEDDQIPF